MGVGRGRKGYQVGRGRQKNGKENDGGGDKRREGKT